MRLLTRSVRSHKYVAAIGGLAGAELGKKRGSHQMIVNGLAITFFAIAEILGVPREEAEEYLPDGGDAA